MRRQLHFNAVRSPRFVMTPTFSLQRGPAADRAVFVGPRVSMPVPSPQAGIAFILGRLCSGMNIGCIYKAETHTVGGPRKWCPDPVDPSRRPSRGMSGPEKIDAFFGAYFPPPKGR